MNRIVDGSVRSGEVLRSETKSGRQMAMMQHYVKVNISGGERLRVMVIQKKNNVSRLY